MKYKVALGQISPGDDKEENFEKIRNMTRRAAGGGASLIVFPEHSEYFGKDFATHAECVPGEVSERFTCMARENKIHLHCGSVSEKHKGQSLPYNTSILFSPNGEIIAKYSKLHMFDVKIKGGTTYLESAEAAAGGEIVLADTKLGCFGMAICYDIRFPEMFRIMAKRGAKLILVAANFTHKTGEAHWLPLLRARAIENGCFIIAADQCGKRKSFHSYGNSAVIDPWGRIIARAGENEELVFADIDTDLADKVRAEIPALYNTRDDVYVLKSNR